MPNPFSVTTDSEDNFAVIRLAGAVDAHTAPQFEEAFQKVIDDGQTNIVVDCEQLTYISSAGLGVFMGFVEEVREADGDIKICGLTEKVKQPFEILGFETLFHFCPDVESSKEKFSEPTDWEASILMETLDRKFTLQVPSSTENLALIREFVSSAAKQAGFDEKEIGKLELAVDEACANVIEHAYGHDASKEVIVRAKLDEHEFSIDIEDTGKGFDPAKVNQEELEQLINKRRTGGLGMRLMKTLMDEVRYEIEPGKKNALHMSKRLKKMDNE